MGSPKTDGNWERDLDIWQSWCRREQQRSIAARHGISHQRVTQIIQRMGGEVPQEAKDSILARTVALYDEWIHEATKLITAPAPPVFDRGEPVIDPRTGNIVEDHSGRLAAMRTGLQVTESWRKLMGLDQPAKVDMTQQVRYVLENVDDADLT
jgi:hypothetical protein